MSNEEILEYINHDFVLKGIFYDGNHVPATIANAIYFYGDNEITHIIAFVDSSENNDGSEGIIISDNAVYYLFDSLAKPVKLTYSKIKNLYFYKNRENKKIVIAEDQEYTLNQAPINIERLIYLLSYITDIKIEMKLSMHEKIAYYIPYIIKDLEEDIYEDITLTKEHLNTIKEIKEELEAIERMDDNDYQYELEKLCIEALKFFDELGLDSEEIDELLEVYKQLEEKDKKEDEMFDTAQRYYDDMMKNYRKGDTAMFDNVKNVMNNFGIDIDDINNKSPEELNNYIDEVCEKFHISRSQLEKIAKRFQKS